MQTLRNIFSRVLNRGKVQANRKLGAVRAQSEDVSRNWDDRKDDVREHFIHVRLLSKGAYLKHDLRYNRAAVQQFATVKLPDKFQREPTVTMTLSFKDRSLKVRHKCSIMQLCFHFEAYLCRNANKIEVKVT